jgi:hypothetical protein|tara:strand:- start:824 stop:1699 length:876 start_codon:yes stop_codon:yes gene_type:complete
MKLKENTMGLPAISSDMTSADLAILANTAVENPQEQLATLRINYEKQDKKKNKLPRGIWALPNKDTTVYGTDITTRVMIASNQVREYSAKEGEYINETIFYNSAFDLKAEDIQGGYRCGKVTFAKREELPDSEQLAQHPKKYYRVLFGLATLKGKDLNGNKAVAENIPFIMRLRGNSLKPINEYLDSFKDTGGNVFDYITKWNIAEGEGGNVDYWITTPERGEESPMLSSSTIVDTFKGLLSWKEDFNEGVMAKWRKKNGLRVSKAADEAVEVAAVVIEPPFDDSLDDLIA